MKNLFLELDPFEALMIENALDVSANLVTLGVCRPAGTTEEDAKEVIEELRKLQSRIVSLLKEAHCA